MKALFSPFWFAALSNASGISKNVYVAQLLMDKGVERNIFLQLLCTGTAASAFVRRQI